ncbi:hypothetical protein JJJ17_02330 [Paracoccus caeni]|uniref:Sulfotransferase family protein n=1 Tax=Paracoccus caeni TaxID=657651 RepID=A0A934VTI4_9RHOB|nr:hypothetical protein [Paracoccus caeni]MBK4214756.1 hypothetical protein [Paracoccus caeni]
MLDFGQLVYLDVQKTGSMYVAAFLRASCRLPLIKAVQHGRIDTRDPSAVHVISVRDPLQQYLSIFRYGLDRRGALYHSLKQRDAEEVYKPTQEGFEEFVQIMLSADLAPILHKDFAAPARKFDIGFMTFRHLLLALPQPLATLNATPGPALSKTYGEKRLWTDVLRQENLTTDLRNLIARYPHLLDADRAETFLAEQATINAAVSGAHLRPVLSETTTALLRQKESLIYSEFYPDQA